MLNQWKELLSRLSMRQKLAIGLAGVLAVAAVVAFSVWSKNRDYKPLFTGMSPEDAGAVVAKLKESAVDYRMSEDGKGILVPSAKVAETRVAMAAAGIPKTGRIGFELFDRANLGATDFAEQVNYRRALEGEIERTIGSIAEIEQSRVHLTFPKDSVFLESRLPAKASVLLRLRPQSQLTSQSVSAITHLVASAVEGLAPTAVSVMDDQGNLLNKPKKIQEPLEASDEAIEYRQRLEKDLLTKINATLEPLLGAGKFRAGVSIECDFTSGEQSEETFDPEKSVMVTSTKTEETGGAATSGGIPGSASNLPRPPARSASAGSGIARKSETIAYQSSKTVRRLRLPQGSVKRISAGVLLDQAVQWDNQGGQPRRVLVPVPPESLKVIRDLVSAAIGFTPARGDQLVLESLPFESTLQTPPPAPAAKPTAAPAPAPQPNPLQILQERRFEALLVLVLVASAIYVVLRHRKKRGAKKVTVAPQLPGRTAEALPAGSASAAIAAEDAKKLLSKAEEAIKAGATARMETLVTAVRTGVGDDPVLAANVLRSWLGEGQS